MKNLKKLLSDDSVEKLFHFGRFDLAILSRTFGIKIRNIYCTKIASKIVRSYTDRHGLKELCRELLGVEISKHEQTSYWGAEILRNEQLKYAANDVLYLHEIKEKLDVMLQREGRMPQAKKFFKFLEECIVNCDLAGQNYSYIFEH